MKLKPEIAQIYAKLNAGDVEAAGLLAREAYLNDLVDPIVLNLVAHRLEEQGELHEAIRILIQATMLDPNDASLHANIGHCLVKLARPTHALEAFNKALKIDPKFPRAHHGAGLALWALGQMENGERAQMRAHQFDPNYAAPLGSLALAAYERKDFKQAQSFIDHALRLDPGEMSCMIVKADLLYDQGEHQACADLLAGVLTANAIAPLQRASLERRYGDVLDALGQYDQAFEAYSTANLQLRRVYSDLFEADDVETTQQMCDRLETAFRTYKAPALSVPRDFAKNGAREHVFLMGFPRSGTTLLEQVLASHHDIIALEERPTLHESIMRYFINDRNIEHLLNASEDELDAWRDVYWQNVKKASVEVSGKVFIDKQPSLTLYIPLLQRLFPNSKIIFCIRDPRDVILGCFRRAFTMNGTIFQYTKLNTLAELYAKSMTLGQVYFDAFPVQKHIHKHEFLIANFEQETQAICRFLGLEFDENMRNFVDTAKRRDIRTPSAKQVRAGLNRSGVAYWRRYERHLQGQFQTLAPWVEAFGYD